MEDKDNKIDPSEKDEIFISEEKEAAPVSERVEEPLVYIGPGFRDSLLSTYGIFADGVPKGFRGTVYEKLFVPASKLDAARALLKQKGSYLSVFFAQALKEHAEKKGA